MFQAFAEFVKSLLIPGTLTFLLFGITIGIALAYGPRRMRRFGLPVIAALTAVYWVISIPIVGELLATRFHAATARQVTAADVAGAQAIVVLGAGVRNSYTVLGRTWTMPDAQTIYNAIEAARIHNLFPGGLPIVASGGVQPDVHEEREAESDILREWLMRAGVPAEHILVESGSRTTREQAQLVAPLLKAHHWERFALVVPAVQGPRAAAVFRKEGVSPIQAAAPYLSEAQRKSESGWLPVAGNLRISERAIYDYMAWGYYWVRGWAR